MTSLIKTDIKDQLLNDLKRLIEDSKKFVAASVNASMTMLFWEIGNRINQYILESKRAEYGKQIVVTLSRQLIQYKSSGIPNRLPDKKLLKEKLHKAIEVSKKRLDQS
jgi:hypothetical protein